MKLFLPAVKPISRTQISDGEEFKMASGKGMKKSFQDVATCYGTRLTKSERKAARKQARKIHTLRRHNSELANISNVPTSHLLVGNGGLMCGIERNHLVNLFGRFGTIKQVVMLPERSYSFVTFDKTIEANAAFEMIHGQTLASPSEFPKSGVTLYLSYLVDVPSETSDSKQQLPPGLIITETFVSEQEENELMEALGWKLDDTQSNETVQQQLHHRKVKHYGYEFLYKTNNVDLTQPLPGGISAVCDSVIECMMSQGIVKFRPDQLTINQYEPGQGIPPHVDTHSAFENEIISLSLGDQVTMDFRHPDGQHLPVVLPRRSLAVMTGESRYLWTHGITPRKYDIIHTGELCSEKEQEATVAESSSRGAERGVTLHERRTRLSFTFRKVRGTTCNCNYPQHCDCKKSQEKPLPPTTTLPSSQSEAAELEKKHVHEVYENIAEHFSGTRHSPWPNIAEFLRSQPTGSVIADVGCGNGKYLGVNQKVFCTGSDRSFNLAAICKQRGYSVIVCDILSLPYRSRAFDVCICIAVLHHLATDERRLAAIQELVRVVRPGGQVLLYVWALEQETEKVKTGKLKEKEFGGKNSADTSNTCSSSDTIKTQCEAQTVQNTSGKKGFDSNNLESLDLQNQTKELKGLVDEKELASEARESVHTQKSSAGKMENETREMLEASSELRVNEKRNVFEQQDVFVPWKYRGATKSKAKKSGVKTQPTAPDEDHVYHRYYHVFKQGELITLCERLDNVAVRRHYYEKGNWCVLLDKTND